MSRIKNMLLILAVLSLAPAFAQDDKDKAAKEFLQAIDKQVDNLTTSLDLEDWQVFYVDSILTYNYTAMQDGLNDLQAKKVSNRDIYMALQYEWMDKTYNAFQALFDDEQWAKYLKSGAAKDKKTREKFFAKRNSK